MGSPRSVGLSKSANNPIAHIRTVLIPSINLLIKSPQALQAFRLTYLAPGCCIGEVRLGYHRVVIVIGV